MAWVGDRLDPEQVKAYITNGLHANFKIRDRIHPDAKFIGVTAVFTQDRLTAVNPVHTGCWINHVITATGIDGETTGTAGGSASTTFNIPNTPGLGSSGIGSGVVIPADQRDALIPRHRIEAFVEFTVTIEDDSGETIVRMDPIRHTQQVMVIDPDEPIVRVTDDPHAAREIIAGCEIEPIVGIRSEGRPAYARNSYGEFTIYFTAPPEAVAGTLYLRTSSGEELKAAPLNLAPSSGTQGVGGMTIQANEDETQRIGLIERIIADGRRSAVKC